VPAAPTLTALDNCGATITGVPSDSTDSTDPCNVLLTRTWTFTDACGNASSVAQTITVSDDTAPEIVCSPDKTVECNATWTFNTPTANDTCGTATVSILSTVTNTTGLCGNTYVATRTWKATDACGNTAQCSQMVTVVDTTAPTLTVPIDSTVSCIGDVPALAALIAQASDNCGAVTVTSNRTQGGTFPTLVTNTFRATDRCGNATTKRQVITVRDTTAPIVLCPGNLSVTSAAGLCGNNVVYALSATDNCGVVTTNQLAGLASGSLFPVGVTTNTFRAADASGNSSQCTFTVTVRDLQPPVITCPPGITTNLPPGWNAVTNLALGTPFTADNCSGARVSNNAAAILLPGTNFVLWTVTDASGNTASCPQRVVVRACSGILSATPLASQSVCPNQPVLFETTASSPEAITYLWKFNGQPIAGQTNHSLLLPSAAASGAGVYAVEVRTACAAVTNSATLTVLSAPGSNSASYTNLDGILINEYGVAAPYGSLITPQCLPGVVKELTVSILGYSHNYPSDASVVLVSPDGRQVKLMAGAGGAESLTAGVDLTFSDAATQTLPELDLIVSGTYRPTDYLPVVSQPPPAAGPYSADLAAFIGANPNGPWSLCVFDASPLDGGSIFSWSLNLEWRETSLYLQNPSVLASGAFRVEVVGQIGIPTIIERSSDFVRWLPVATNLYSTSPGVFIDPPPLPPARFYRVVQP
jgi:hypothetical protein